MDPGVDNDGSKANLDGTNVLIFKHLPNDCSETDLEAFSCQFGSIQSVLKVHGRDYAFVEFDSPASAAACLTFCHSNSPNIKGSVVDAQYSSRRRVIKTTHPVTQVKLFRASPVLLVTLTTCPQMIDCDVLFQIFSQFGGHVLRVIIFDKAGHTQALIEMGSIQDAIAAKQALDGQSLFDSTCVVRVQFSERKTLQVKGGKNSRDFTTSGAEYYGPLPSPYTSQSHGGQSHSVRAYADPPLVVVPSPCMGHHIFLYRSPGAGSSVLLVSNLDEERMNCFAIFQLFGVYGDVFRVKILFKDRSKALVQFRDAEQAANAMRFLNGVPVGGKPLRIMPSMLTEVQLPLTDSMEGAELTQDFITHPLHRYKIPGSKNFQHLAPPSASLHVANLPVDVSAVDVLQLFSAFGEVESFEYFSNTQKMGVITMKSLDAAIAALIGLHGYRFEGHSQGLRGVSVSFSARGNHRLRPPDTPSTALASSSSTLPPSNQL
eukprot:EG_transcript_2834